MHVYENTVNTWHTQRLYYLTKATSLLRLFKNYTTSMI